MRLPRFRIRRMMVVVAVVGICCGGIISALRRPYPTDRFHRSPSGPGLGTGPPVPSELYQAWSDGWVIRVDETRPDVKARTRYGRLLRVEWSDGSTSWYWPGPFPYHKHGKWWDGKQTWHITWGEGPLGSGGHTTGPYPDERPPH